MSTANQTKKRAVPFGGIMLILVGGGVIIMEMPNAEPLKQTVETIFTASQYIWPLALVGLGPWIIFKRREA